jgi:hypothetical protein
MEVTSLEVVYGIVVVDLEEEPMDIGLTPPGLSGALRGPA